MLIKFKDSTKIVGVSRIPGNGVGMQNDLDKIKSVS